MAAKKKIVKKKTTKKKSKKKVGKKKSAKKKIGGRKSKAIERSEKEKQSAMHGNSFWMARSSHGRNPIFKNKEDLWDACIQYFIWVEENPLISEKLFSFNGLVHKGTINKMRAMTIGGLCIFLGVCQKTWSNYRENKDFLQVTSTVEDIVRNQKFEGAAADLLNANIIARDLGLKDKTENDNTNKNYDFSDKTDEELNAIIKGTA